MSVRQLARTLAPESPQEPSGERAASSGSSRPHSPAGSHRPDLPYSLCKSWKRQKNREKKLIIKNKKKLKIKPR